MFIIENKKLHDSSGRELTWQAQGIEFKAQYCPPKKLGINLAFNFVNLLPCQVLCDLFQTAPQRSNLPTSGNISGFVRRLFLQLMLEDEKVTMFLQSPCPVSIQHLNLNDFSYVLVYHMVSCESLHSSVIFFSFLIKQTKVRTNFVLNDRT